ncbi:MAG TPA: aminoglycoside phosphotransferase family protein [Acidimicrobiales bacterium]|nr:aminoglycoside phosphotransferase family protein [Acidimicrobiales bacterium]
MANPMPAAEVDISEDLVRCLLAEQHADLADREVRFESEGWDCAIFRLGDDLAVRLPRRAINAALMPDELRWLPQLAPQLTLAVNTPVRAGAPGCGYPWPWAVTAWFDGSSWADAPVDDPRLAAETLGEFVRSLATPAPDDAPTNPYRGGPLSDRDQAVRERLQQLGASIDAATVLDIWSDALGAPKNAPRRWLHGDLHPANVIVRHGRLVAVIDWVDMCGGDWAYDLAAAWICFDDPAARAAFKLAAGVQDDAAWRRARGCALSHGIACLANSADNPRMRAVGEATLAAVLADA